MKHVDPPRLGRREVFRFVFWIGAALLLMWLFFYTIGSAVRTGWGN